MLLWERRQPRSPQPVREYENHSPEIKRLTAWIVAAEMKSASRLPPLLRKSNAWDTGQNLILPIRMSLYITQSPTNEYSGCLNVAGRFFSKKKCPTHANA